MTCTHQWHDATTSAGPEWVCAKCKVTYTQTKKAPPAPKREWVGLTDEERFKVAEQTGCMSADWLDVVKATETALQIKNQ